MPKKEVLQQRFEDVGIGDLAKRTKLFDNIADDLLTTNTVIAFVVEALAQYEKLLELSKAMEPCCLTLEDLRRIDIKCVVALILRDHPKALEELEGMINASVEKTAAS